MGGGVFLADVRAHQFAEFLDGVMHDEADVADAEPGDVGDFLIRAVMLKLEPHDLALVRPQSVHATPDVLIELMHARALGRIRFVIRRGVDDLIVAQIKPLLLAQDVKGTVAADGEEPGFEVVSDLLRLGEVEPQHRVLHDVTRTLNVSTEDACCVGDKGAFMLVQRTPDQHGGFILYVWVGHARVQGWNEQTLVKIRPGRKLTPFFHLGNRNLCPGPGVQTGIVSDSSSTGTSFVLILLALGGGVWLVKDALTPAPKLAPAAPEEEATSLPSRALDASKTSGAALNNSMSDQLKTVQGMVGGSYDGQTYVPPKGK